MKLKTMSTILVTKKWQPKPTKKLAKSDPVKEGKMLSMDHKTQNSHVSAQDLMGLSWVLYDDFEYNAPQGKKVF